MESLSLVNSNCSEISNNLLGSAAVALPLFVCTRLLGCFLSFDGTKVLRVAGGMRQEGAKARPAGAGIRGVGACWEPWRCAATTGRRATAPKRCSGPPSLPPCELSNSLSLSLYIYMFSMLFFVSCRSLMLATGTSIEKYFLVPFFALQAPSSAISWIK
jgi:hypothetical protein